MRLYGSLGATGRGHGSDRAVIAGLSGELPEETTPEAIDCLQQGLEAGEDLRIVGSHRIVFRPVTDLLFLNESLPYHPNGMQIAAYDVTGQCLYERTYYSVGGGFVVDETAAGGNRIVEDRTELSHPFSSANELLRHCDAAGLSISSLMLRNELAWRSESEVRAGLLHLWSVMRQCVERGCRNEGILPGGLKVRRRAPQLYRKLHAEKAAADAFASMEWVNLWAIAVNEENAAGGKVVTAPTNGAAGIIPAVLHYYHHFCAGADDDGTVRFLLTAGAVGMLFKMNASISGAEVGCQGEVGAACSMAAGGLAEVLGGTPQQVENAAEIGMEHNLGLTCDPIGGLVQVPCIERNAMGAVKAINAARLALRGDGKHFVSLDKVIRTMRDTGRDMNARYKETSRGGLAVNIIEC
ncbi:L-serine dehydratase [Planctomycetia bacterium]|nr:L-serine dehydratase [Planctomycetia bacterium]